MKLAKKNDRAVLVFEIRAFVSLPLLPPVTLGTIISIHSCDSRSMRSMEKGRALLISFYVYCSIAVVRWRGKTNAGHPLQVNHDVGVTVLAPIQVKELREPCCPTPDVSRLLSRPHFLPSSLLTSTSYLIRRRSCCLLWGRG